MIPPSQRRRKVQAAWAILALKAMVIALYVFPWYHPGYRMAVNWLGLLLLLSSLLALAFVLLPHYFVARRLWPLLACLGITAVLMIAAANRHDWRVALTDQWIQLQHCTPPMHPQQIVLGGLKQVGGLSGGVLAFLNDTHCLSVSCTEEFFECRAAAQPTLRSQRGP
jgi:hypothetical protein